MTRRLVPLVSILILVFAASPAWAQATTWQVDPAHTATEFAVKHMMVSTVRGQFTRTTGTAVWDGKNVSSAVVNIVIDAASIDTRHPDRDSHLRSAEFLNVAKYPTITFKSAKIEPAGPGRARVTGDLTIRGVTRQVVLDVEGPSAPVKDPASATRVGASATTKISRKDFGLIYNKVLEGGGAIVGDEVTITIDVEIVSVPVGK
jgi:polyisoprenoid-binding protein YceI